MRYGKQRVCWVPRFLTKDHKTSANKYFLERHAVQRHGVLNSVLTGNKIWSYHVDLEEKSKKTKSKPKPSTSKTIRTVFWDAGGCIWT